MCDKILNNRSKIKTAKSRKPIPYSRFLNPNKKGFTIAELLFATIIVAILVSSASAIYVNFYNSTRNLKAANLIYEEARFTMERIVKEIRNGTVDYEEYYNQAANFAGNPQSSNLTLGSNYCQYSRQFYGPGPDGVFGTLDDESTGKRKAGAPAPFNSIIQNNLYLINTEGNKRTYIKRQVGTDGYGKVAFLKLTGYDYGLDHLNSSFAASACPKDKGERDGLIDTWLCEPGFDCTPYINGPPPFCNGLYTHTIKDYPANPANSSFVPINPDSLDIVDLKFFITPMDDPYKAYNEPSVQIQPHVTIKLIARATPDIAAQFKGATPDIVLESTVSARAYNPIITECNLQECIDGTTRSCPKLGVAATAGTEVTCSQGVWPLCTDDVYLSFVDPYFGSPGSVFAGQGQYDTFYESEDETGSCTKAFTDPGDIATCKSKRCSDGLDNDGDGLTDENDTACIEDLCHNGVFDPIVEDCTDVGDKCRWRPLLQNEDKDTCFDGYDNDCDGNADEFDLDCVAIICDDGQQSPSVGNEFVDSSYTPKNYLFNATTNPASALNESCKDVGGLCKDVSKIVKGNPLAQDIIPVEENDYCYDGLDNDCDGLADEFDPGCQAAICSDLVISNLLADSSFPTKDYLFGYRQDIAKATLESTDNDEQCVDAGGVCGALPADEDTPTLCQDNIDNDCDGNKDQLDSGCCPDNDIDTFSPALAGMCSPLTGQVDSNGIVLFAGEVDCDDSDSSISPGATEVCDDATYASGPLTGQPIDNNCSGANTITVDGWDHNDPSCCTDLDSDGFGIQAAYLFEDTVSGACAKSVAQSKFDCNDTDPAINPDATESCPLTGDDGDQNCSGPQSATDADTGTDDTDLACCADNDSDGKYGGPSCVPLGLFPANDVDCDDSNPNVHPGIALDICDNTLDDDCNGKTDTLDDYCLYASKTRFLDNLTTQDFLNTIGPGLTKVTSGIHLNLGTASDTVESKSLPVDASCSAILTGQLVNMVYDLAGGSGANEDISVQFSHNNGAVWCGDDNCTGDWITLTEFLSGETTVTFSGGGTTLLWRAKITDLNKDNEVLLDNIDIAFTCA